jgi:dTMP kinase
MATSGIIPDLTLFIDCPVAIGLKRARRRIARKERSVDDSRFEQKELDFHYKVRSGYLELSKKEPERIKVIDGNQDIMRIHSEVVALVSEKLGEKRKA